MSSATEKKLLLLGGSGKTGILAAQYALDEGYSVVILARTPENITLHHPKLTIIQGTPDKVEDVRKAIIGCQYVLSTLANNPTSFINSTNPNDQMTKMMKNTVQAMNEEGVRRIVVMTAWGVGDSYPELGFVFRLLFAHSGLKVTMEDHNSQEKLIREADLDWTFVRPVILTKQKNVKLVKETYNNIPVPSSKISRFNVARYCVDALDDPEMIRKAPTISEDC